MEIKTYISNYPNYTIKLFPDKESINEKGEKILVESGKVAAFKNAAFSTDDPAVIEAIEKSSAFGVSIFDMNAGKKIIEPLEKKAAENKVEVVEGPRLSVNQLRRPGRPRK